MVKRMPIIIMGFLLFPQAVFASFPFDTPTYFPAPVTIQVKFNNDNSNNIAFGKSGILDAITGTMTLDVRADGSFSKTITVKNKVHFATDPNLEPGVFSLYGKYNKGNISSQWTYNLDIPTRKSWNFPESFNASGVFYTYQPISQQSGIGIIEGRMTWNRWIWKDKKMVDRKEEIIEESMRNTWMAISSCAEPICGCFDLGDTTDSFARFNSLTGEVSFAHCSKDEKTQEWIPATPKTRLMVNDHIATGFDSSAILQFKDMTTFQMKPNTEVIVKSPPDQETKLGLVSGHLWINFKKMLTNGTMEVEMGQAVAGIKGTTLVLEQENGVSTLKVLDGVVSFTSKETGKVLDVKTGEKVSADFNDLSAVEKFDVAKESAQWKPLAEITIVSEAGDWPIGWIVTVVGIIGVLGFFMMKKRK